MSTHYVEIEPGRWVRTEGTKADVLIVADLQTELSEINARLAEIPADLTDDELLAWAKLHYPAMDYSKERETLNTRRDAIEADLSNMGQ